MTRDDALTVTEYVLNAWAKPDWDEGHAEAFVAGLMPYDAELATKAVALAHKTVEFRPSLAEFLKFYRAVKSDMQARQAIAQPRPKRDTNKMPPWVRAWVCARLLHDKFGREQDMRRFVEQQEWADPDLPLMPPDEWAKEAAAIGDREAMRAIQGTVWKM